jgi:hypothetical protein
MGIISLEALDLINAQRYLEQGHAMYPDDLAILDNLALVFTVYVLLLCCYVFLDFVLFLFIRFSFLDGIAFYCIASVIIMKNLLV